MSIATQIQIDAEFKSLIPPLTAGELAQLEANIVAEGCRDKLVIWSGHDILVDGHNRYEICERLGLGYEVVEREFADRDAVKLWIEENQLGRRNLTDDQRAAVAYRVQVARSEKAKRERTSAAHEATRLSSRSKLTDVSDDVSDTSVKAGKKDTRAAVAKEAKIPERKLRDVGTVAKAAPDLLPKIADGKMTVKQAKKEVGRREREAAKAAIPADLPSVTERYTVIHGDLANITDDQIADGSLDWIITDPPYPKEYLPVYDSLAEFSARKLKDGGSIICMIGQSYLPQIVASLSRCLTYRWTHAYMMPGQGVTVWDRNVNTFWKPLLWYTKGDYSCAQLSDVFKSDMNDKRFHHWGQSEGGMAQIVERFTLPGQVVCDPFSGGGTTGVVSVQLNRRFIGIDISEDAVKQTKARLVEIHGDH